MSSGQLNDSDHTQVVIRLATASDADLLAHFRYTFRASIAAANENREAFVQRCSLWMRERLQENSQWHCWIAELDQIPVGHLWLQRIEKIPNPTAEPEYHAYITNVFVKEEVRGKGIGGMLLRAALEVCRAQNVDAVILWPTQHSRTLYLRHGFAVRDDLLELVLADEKQSGN